MEEVRICDYCGRVLAEEEGTPVDDELLCDDRVEEHCVTCDHYCRVDRRKTKTKKSKSSGIVGARENKTGNQTARAKAAGTYRL